MSLALALLLKYWKTAALVAALVALGWSFDAWKSSLRAQGAWAEKYRVADSTSRANAKAYARVDTLVVHDTVKVRVAISHVVTMRDTVLQHLTDTVLVKQFVARADTAAKVCSELSTDCAEYRRLTTIELGALRSKLAAVPQAKPQRHTASDILWFTLGAVGGAAGGYLAHHR